jgi:hypothetical protein
MEDGVKIERKYPKQIIVFLENEGDEDEYLGVFDSFENVASFDGLRRVALYDLKDVVSVTAKAEIK